MSIDTVYNLSDPDDRSEFQKELGAELRRMHDEMLSDAADFAHAAAIEVISRIMKEIPPEMIPVFKMAMARVAQHSTATEETPIDLSNLLNNLVYPRN